jgi:hypothetical protein
MLAIHELAHAIWTTELLRDYRSFFAQFLISHPQTSNGNDVATNMNMLLTDVFENSVAYEQIGEGDQRIWID